MHGFDLSDMQGNAWGCDGDEPYYLNDVGSSMFQACLSDGFSYDEAAECAAEWQRQEEKIIGNSDEYLSNYNKLTKLKRRAYGI